MKKMHFDLYSLQAERFMADIRPLLPDTPNGQILKSWDCQYESDSKGAMLFESVYRALINTVFGDNGLGREAIDHIFTETGLFNDYYANLDDVLFREDSAWFEGEEKTEIFRRAVAEGLSTEARPYGEGMTVTLSHLLFGGQVPRFLGFDRGPITLPGGRATIPQGQIFKSADRLTTFSPSYRFIADMADDGIESNIAGGPSDRRFSPWYISDLENWLNGVYKKLT
jgi:penicillin amidase